MKTDYMQARGTRSEYSQPAGRFRGGKLMPVGCQYFGQSESGVLSQRITLELDPVAGRMLSAVTAEVHVVAVPALAIDALKNPTSETAGIAEVFREKLIAGPVFGLEPEGAISKACHVHPRSVGGVKYVNEAVRIGHNCAVNYLRQRRHVKAALLDKNNAAITPALLSRTILELMNGVLNPEDRVNGAVNLSGKIPVTGIRHSAALVGSGAVSMENLAGSTRMFAGGTRWLDIDRQLFADMDLAGANLTLEQFYLAEEQDKIIRRLRSVVDKNPELGEEIVTRMAYGLGVETGRIPFMIYQRSGPLANGAIRAMDGDNLGDMQTESDGSISFSAVVPATEFGTFVYTFVSVKPDEVLYQQPHPLLSKVIGGRNYLAEEMLIDPVQVTMRDLDANVATGSETTPALYVGPNHLERRYATYGFTRLTDLTKVAEKTAIWQLKIPLSVTPSTVIYPETLDHYPFKDATADVVQYNMQSQCIIATPIKFGPTPLEELAEVEVENLFGDN